MGQPRTMGWGGLVKRAEITLRGVRFPDQHGEVVPWLNLGVHRHQGGMNLLPVDGDGRRLRFEGRKFHWAVPLGQLRTVRWAMRRAEQRSLEHGTYDIVERDVERSQVRIVLPIMLLLMIFALVQFVLVIALSALNGNAGMPPLTQAASIAVVFAMPLLLLVVFFVIAVPMWRRATTNVERVRVTPEGIEAWLFDGSVERIRREDVRHIWEQWKVFRIDAVDGRQLRMWAARSAFVLVDWQGNQAAARKRLSTRSILVRSFIWCQIGGVLAAALVAGMGIQSQQGPVACYLMVGFLIPAAMALTLLVEPGMERVSRKPRRKRITRTLQTKVSE